MNDNKVKTLHTIGDYRITSEKVDECLPNWEWASVISAFFVMGITFLTSIYYVNLADPLKLEDYLAPATILMVGLGFSFFLGILPQISKNCGIRISIVTDNDLISTCESTYRFTNDPDKDAVKIQKIIDGYIHASTQSTKLKREEQKQDQEHSKQCCTQYQERMEKVKL